MTDLPVAEEGSSETAHPWIFWGLE